MNKHFKPEEYNASNKVFFNNKYINNKQNQHFKYYSSNFSMQNI